MDLGYPFDLYIDESNCVYAKTYDSWDKWTAQKIDWPRDPDDYLSLTSGLYLCYSDTHGIGWAKSTKSTQDLPPQSMVYNMIYHWQNHRVAPWFRGLSADGLEGPQGENYYSTSHYPMLCSPNPNTSLPQGPSHPLFPLRVHSCNSPGGNLLLTSQRSRSWPSLRACCCMYPCWCVYSVPFFWRHQMLSSPGAQLQPRALCGCERALQPCHLYNRTLHIKPQLRVRTCSHLSLFQRWLLHRQCGSTRD